MPRPAREAILSALFTDLVSTVTTNFKADTQVNNPVLANVTAGAVFFLGLPVVGPGIQDGSVITQLSPLTLSLPATGNALQQPMVAGCQTTSRRLQMWDKVNAQPALFLRDLDESLDYPNIILQRQTIRAEIWLYSKAGANPDIAPATMLNNLLDAVQAALAPDDPMRQRYTIGGLVEWCRLAGKVEKAPGDLDGQAIAVAEVEITVP